MYNENHTAIRFGTDEEEEWLCNGSEIFKNGCYSGQTDLKIKHNVNGWACMFNEMDCDFDLCETCIQHCLWTEE